MASMVKKHNEESFKFKINGAEFWCNFLISRNENAENAYSNEDGLMLTQSSIISLDLHESLFEPFVSGSITINNPYDYFDEKHNVSGAGEDFLHIRFYDYTDQENPNLDLIKLEYSFVITAESNSVSKTDRSNNFKSFSLIDKNYFKLNKLVPYNISFPRQDRVNSKGEKVYAKKSIGDIIKDDILIPVLGEDIIDDDNWDSGLHIIDKAVGTELSSYLERIHPGVHWRYSDILKYLLRFNYAETQNGLPVQTFLQFDRSKNKYTLKPLNEYFKNNDRYVQEAFAIGDLTPVSSEYERSQTNTYSSNKNNPYSNEDIPFNLYQGTIKNADLSTPYTFYTNEFFVNYIVSDYNTFLGSTFITKITVEDTKRLWEEDFIKSFKLLGGTPNAFLNFTDEGNRPIKPFSLPKFEHQDCVNITRAQMVSNLTFFNLQLTLDNLGDTGRKPGRFVDVVKFIEEEDLVDKKLLGRWFVTNVHHRFFKTSYQTLIQCIKPYVGPARDVRVDDARLAPSINNLLTTNQQYA